MPVFRCLAVVAILCLMVGCATTEDATVAAPAKPQLDTLMRAELAAQEGTEVIVSHVVIPPHTTLPLHWHPGEEFVYIQSGSATLIRPGHDDLIGQAGDVIQVPYKAHHTARTGADGVSLIVFRVHETGQPERVLVK